MAEPRSLPSSTMLPLLVETLQCFDRLEVIPGFSHEHEVAYTKFSVQRMRLVLWGSCLGVDNPKHEPSSTERLTKMCTVRKVASIRESDLGQYGLRPLPEPSLQPSMPLSYQSNPGSRGFDLFKRAFNAYMRRLSGHIDNAKSAQYSKLCVTDVACFSDFVNDLEQCLDDLYGPSNNEKAIQDTLRWRASFYEEMITVAEEPDSLSLLVQASSGAHDAFGNFASRRLQEREGRSVTTLWKRFRTFEDDGDRLIFNFWHRLLHRLIPNCLQGGAAESSRHVPTTAPHPRVLSKEQPQYLAFCSRLAVVHSELAEVDLSTIKSNAELSRAIREKLPHLWRNDKDCIIRRALVRFSSVRLIQVCDWEQPLLTSLSLSP